MAGQIDNIYDLSLFKHQCTDTVRFADLDVLGHVNHAKYLTYMEQARVMYAEDVWKWEGDMETLGMIIASIEVNYIAPLFFRETITVWTRIARLGLKSFDFLYVMTRGEEIVATGKTAMVAYDYPTGKTCPINPVWREKSLAYEISFSTN